MKKVARSRVFLTFGWRMLKVNSCVAGAVRQRLEAVVDLTCPVMLCLAMLAQVKDCLVPLAGMTRSSQ